MIAGAIPALLLTPLIGHAPARLGGHQTPWPVDARNPAAAIQVIDAGRGDSVVESSIDPALGSCDGECQDPSLHQGLDDGELDALTAEVARQLRCPVCRQLSIEDSPSDLAQEMKGVIRERLAAGETPEEVKEYFVSKYGEWILLEPPMKGFNLVVWLFPVVALLGGAALLGYRFRRWMSRHPATGRADTGPDPDAHAGSDPPAQAGHTSREEVPEGTGRVGHSPRGAVPEAAIGRTPLDDPPD